jgi:hypothetical protein
MALSGLETSFFLELAALRIASISYFLLMKGAEALMNSFLLIKAASFCLD